MGIRKANEDPLGMGAKLGIATTLIDRLQYKPALLAAQGLVFQYTGQTQVNRQYSFAPMGLYGLTLRIEDTSIVPAATTIIDCCTSPLKFTARDNTLNEVTRKTLQWNPWDRHDYFAWCLRAMWNDIVKHQSGSVVSTNSPVINDDLMAVTDGKDGKEQALVSLYGLSHKILAGVRQGQSENFDELQGIDPGVMDFIYRQLRCHALPSELKTIFYWSPSNEEVWKNVVFAGLTGWLKLLEAVPLCIELTLEHACNYLKHAMLKTFGEGAGAVFFTFMLVSLCRIPVFAISFVRQCLIRPITSPMTSYQVAKDTGGLPLALLSAVVSVAAWLAICCYALPVALDAIAVALVGHTLSSVTPTVFASAFSHLPFLHAGGAKAALAGLCTVSGGSAMAIGVVGSVASNGLFGVPAPEVAVGSGRSVMFDIDPNY